MTLMTRLGPGHQGQANWRSGLSFEDREVYETIPSEVDYVDHPSFAQGQTEDCLWGPEAEEIEIPQWNQFPEGPDQPTAPRKGRIKLNQEDETKLFLRYNYARFRLSRLRAAQDRRASVARAREMVLWSRRARKTRSDIVQANMALVVAMARRTRIPNVEFAEIISEGNVAMLRAVEKFDVSRGFKFSTYACRAILQSFNRLATKTGRYSQRFPAAYDPEMEHSDYDERRQEQQRQDTVSDVQEVLARNSAQLTAIERKIIDARFALNGEQRRLTLGEVGKMVGLTNERVRQVQNATLTKLRAALEDHCETLRSVG